MIHQNWSDLANIYAEINACFESDQNQSVKKNEETVWIFLESV